MSEHEVNFANSVKELKVRYDYSNFCDVNFDNILSIARHIKCVDNDILFHPLCRKESISTYNSTKFNDSNFTTAVKLPNSGSTLDSEHICLVVGIDDSVTYKNFSNLNVLDIVDLNRRMGSRNTFYYDGIPFICSNPSFILSKLNFDIINKYGIFVDMNKKLDLNIDNIDDVVASVSSIVLSENYLLVSILQTKNTTDFRNVVKLESSKEADKLTPLVTAVVINTPQGTNALMKKCLVVNPRLLIPTTVNGIEMAYLRISDWLCIIDDPILFNN